MTNATAFTQFGT